VSPVAPKSRGYSGLAVLLVAGVLIAGATTVHVRHNAAVELLSPLEVGRYAVRAERQSHDYDSKAERQIALATDNDDEASSERQLAAKEEKRARNSAYLAADVKSRIDKILEAGRDQVIFKGGAVCGQMALACGVLARGLGQALAERTSYVGPAGAGEAVAEDYASC
jgi:outer membrane translocation and assembly module TamA